MLSKKSSQLPVYQLAAPLLGGIFAITVVLGLFIWATAPQRTVGSISLPQDIQPVAISTSTIAASNSSPVIEVPKLSNLISEPTPPNIPAGLPSAERGSSSVVLPQETPRPAASAIIPAAAPREVPRREIDTPIEPALAPLPGITPRRMRIPTLGINALIEHVGLDTKNRMDVPRNIWNVAWYKLGAKPGERGNAAIAGHLDGPNTPAIFWDLNKIQVGARIYLTGDNNEEKVFEVYEIGLYPFDKAPMDKIFGATTNAQLNLITCNGTYNPNADNYDQRFVAYTRLVPNA